MRITTKGQVKIPREVRERMGFLPHSEVEFVIEGNAVYIRKEEGLQSGNRHLSKNIVERMRGRATVRMSTDEIMALTRG